MSMQDDDMEAVNRYFMSTPIVTSQANKLKTEWLAWYDNLGWYEKSFDSTIWDIARNKRLAFNLANSKTEADKKAAIHQATTGVTTEEIAGGTRRTTEAGEYVDESGEAVTAEKYVEPLMSTRLKIYLAVGGALAAVGWGLKKVYLDNNPFIKAARLKLGK